MPGEPTETQARVRKIGKERAEKITDHLTRKLGAVKKEQGWQGSVQTAGSERRQVHKHIWVVKRRGGGGSGEGGVYCQTSLKGIDIS